METPHFVHFFQMLFYKHFWHMTDKPWLLMSYLPLPYLTRLAISETSRLHPPICLWIESIKNHFPETFVHERLNDGESDCICFALAGMHGRGMMRTTVVLYSPNARTPLPTFTNASTTETAERGCGHWERRACCTYCKNAYRVHLLYRATCARRTRVVKGAWMNYLLWDTFFLFVYLVFFF